MNKKLNTEAKKNACNKERGERLTVRDLPVSERPYEKCELYGPQSLSDAELIAVIIKTGTARERSVELAYRVLNFSMHKGVNCLFHLDLNELMSLKGIGRVKAIQLICVAELARRMNRAERYEHICFSDSSTVADYYMEDLRHLEREETVAVFLDTRLNLIYDRVIFKGTSDVSFFEPKDILIEALRAQAAKLIILHNHPTGDATPSNMDIAATGRLMEACRIVGIELYDHIVIGDNCYVSFRKSELIK